LTVLARVLFEGCFFASDVEAGDGVGVAAGADGDLLAVV
jgi:hypothetical protein